MVLKFKTIIPLKDYEKNEEIIWDIYIHKKINRKNQNFEIVVFKIKKEKRIHGCTIIPKYSSSFYTHHGGL